MRVYVFQCPTCGSLTGVTDADILRVFGPTGVALTAGQTRFTRHCLLQRDTTTVCQGWPLYLGFLNTIAAPAADDTAAIPGG